MGERVDVSHLLLRNDVRARVEGCRDCNLCDVGSGPIPFRGPSPSKIAVIGEAPGRVEDAVKQPFRGPSGQYAESVLRAEGIDPDSAAWLNVVSCFPNRTPTDREVGACRGNLLAQLSIIRPSYCIVLGGVATKVWWPSIRMGDIRGLFWQANVGLSYRPWMLATWHPSAVLRNGIGSSRDKEVRADVARFRELLATDESGADYLTRFRLFANFYCISCGERAERWILDTGAETEHVDGGIGYCRKHWDWLKGNAGGGKATPRRRAKKTVDVPVQEGLL